MLCQQMLPWLQLSTPFEFKSGVNSYVQFFFSAPPPPPQGAAEVLKLTELAASAEEEVT